MDRMTVAVRSSSCGLPSVSFSEAYLTSPLKVCTRIATTTTTGGSRAVQQPQQQQSVHTSLLLLQRGGQRLNQHARRRGRGSSVSVSVFAKQAAVAPPAAVETTGPKEQYDCVVVGGGISGLCTAQALATGHGVSVSNVLVTEARERVGGNIMTVEGNGYLWEEGPNSFQPNDSMLSMVVDSGLKEELVLGDPDAPRFVLWGGRLRPVPAGPADLPFFDLLSIMGKLRAGFGAMGFKAPAPGREESVEEFVRRNLGDEVFERLIEPFCSGVYAGDPAKLSMKAAFGKVWRLEDIGGSIVGGTIKLLQERKKNPPPPRDTRLPKPKGQTVGSSQTVGPHCSSSVHFALFQFPPTRVQSQTCDPKARTQNLLEKIP